MATRPKLSGSLLFGLKVGRDDYFAKVRLNDALTLLFSDEDKDFDSHHYAFHVTDAEFDAIFGWVKAKGIPYGSGPDSHTNSRIYQRRGGRGLYFEDPSGHLLEVMTVRETGS